MEKEIKFAPKDIDEELAKIGMLERMRDIIEYAIKENLAAREALLIMEREINLIKDAVSLDNKIAREEYVRRRLGVDGSAILTSEYYAKIFNLFSR
ncbi:hypothetical protein OHE94_20420 [Escherichia coli]|uniref:hypothetical protein n=1 Tax=Escherichia coli TaxID=562 RepID=UPI0021E95961|nr:hypothetical protein [Escherichia coli]MCV2898937.1 hypothetical protein [Escherichia coli]